MYADGFRRNAPATVGLPGLKDAVDDMSVANLDPDHDALITGKPTLDEAASTSRRAQMKSPGRIGRPGLKFTTPRMGV